ncbi:MAG: glycosyltransferase [Candidatus Lokiarchaeota archaeon]|nr:glycosyltransferase [Candidatus Lokiarchaeota archaeon]
MKVLISISNPEKNRQKDYYFINLVNQLRNEGIQVNYLKNSLLFPLSRNLILKGIKILNIHWINSFTNFSRKPIKTIIGTLVFIIDILIAKIFLKTKIIWTIHNLYSHEFFYPKLEHIVRKNFARISDYLVVHCKKAKSIIAQEFKINQKKIEVIPHGNYIKNYPNNISMKDSRELLNINQNDFIFLHFGRIRPHKNVELVIKSFEEIQYSGVKLMIVGNPLRSNYSKIYNLVENKENIFNRLEFIPDDEVQIYMNAADIIILSYKKILTSGEALLAMSFNKPLIAPYLGCLVDVLDKDNTFFYKYNSKKSLMKALEKSLGNRSILNDMGRISYLKSKSYDWNEIAKKYIKTYDKPKKKNNRIRAYKDFNR